MQRSSAPATHVLHSTHPGLAIGLLLLHVLPPSAVLFCLLQLKSPGVQREILSAAVTDPEVFSILASKMDLVRAGCGEGAAGSVHRCTVTSAAALAAGAALQLYTCTPW